MNPNMTLELFNFDMFFFSLTDRVTGVRGFHSVQYLELNDIISFRTFYTFVSPLLSCLSDSSHYKT